MPHQEYMVDGVKYPSVTEILGDKPKPWLEAWKQKWGALAERKTACANAIGTAFHEGAERLSRQEDVPCPANIRLAKMLGRIEEWLMESEFVPAQTEFHVVSALHKYQGTLDATGTIAKYKRKPVLVDYKSSSGIYADFGLQLAAYAQAYKETAGVDIAHGLIVHVSKDKPHHRLTVKEYKLGKRLLNAFLKRLAQYREYNTPVKGLDA